MGGKISQLFLGTFYFFLSLKASLGQLCIEVITLMGFHAWMKVPTLSTHNLLFRQIVFEI